MAADTSSSQSTDGAQVTDDCRPCFWKKLEILARPIAATLTTVTIAILGYWGQQSISAITQIEQNSRLYTELLSRREESESALRKDMFNTILGDFFVASEAGKGEGEGMACHRYLDQGLLKFELLALNFSESLSLSPVFNEMKRSINGRCDYASEGLSAGSALKDQHNKRLRSLARRVAERQVAALMHKSETAFFSFDQVSLGADNSYEWPLEADESRLERCLSLPGTGIARMISLVFSEANVHSESVKVRMSIGTLVWAGSAREIPQDFCAVIEGNEAAEQPLPLISKPGTSITFSLDYHNFPLIDNTLLSKDQRLAIILEGIDRVDSETGEALESPTYNVRVLLFPGQYSSRRDTPVIADVIEQLRKATRETTIEAITR